MLIIIELKPKIPH